MPDRVEHDHRLVMHTQIARCPGFEELLEGADAAGQRDERVGAVLHDLLALAHGVGDDELVGFGVGDLPVHQRFGDDADGSAATGAGRACQRAHGRDVAAAGHQRPAALGDRFSDADGQRQQLRMRWPGRAVHTDRPFAVGFWGHMDNVAIDSGGAS